MPIDPLIPLSYRPPDINPVRSIGEIMALRGMAQQQRLREQQIEESRQTNEALAEQRRAQAERNRLEAEQIKMDQQDANTIKEAWANPETATKFGAGDFSSIQGKVQPKTYQNLEKWHVDQLENKTKLTDAQLRQEQTKHLAIADAVEGLQSLPGDAARAREYPNVISRLKAGGVFAPTDNIPAQISGKPEELNQFAAVNGAMLELNKRAMAKKEAEAKAKHEEEMAKPTEQREFEFAQSNGYKGTFEDFLKMKANLKEPKEKEATGREATIQEYLTAHPGATRLQAESAVSAATRDTSGKEEGRTDRSYNTEVKRLDATRKPIDETFSRAARLEETLKQGTPQADAIAAPELLTVMAGGQGSGLRMSEAELSRVVGGRSKWESLKAAMQQWATDPSKANSLTTEQRNEMKSLVNAVGAKLRQKKAVIDKAEDALIDAKTPDEHRRIMARMNRDLAAIDGAGGEGESTAVPAVGGMFDGKKVLKVERIK